MQNDLFHNNKSIIKNNDKKKSILFQYGNEKCNVDINKLLNRVRMEKKSETKRKIFFFSSVILALGISITLITIIK